MELGYASDLTAEQWKLVERVQAHRHAWRVAHGRLGRSRQLAKSFEETGSSATGWLQVACIAAALDALIRDVS